MAKKKNKQKKTDTFQGNPFSFLKGFAVSEAEPEVPVQPQPPVPTEEPEISAEDLFAREMNMLGVKRSSGKPPENQPSVETELKPVDSKPVTDEEQFLAAMGEMTTQFEDHFPEVEEPHQASPRRMKLMKQGRLQPEATLDLHGLLRHQVVERVRFFLDDAKFQGYRTLLIITGRGLHSQGEPVLRSEVERFLRGDGRPLLAEWARAPRQYGGDGALVVFLKD